MVDASVDAVIAPVDVFTGKPRFGPLFAEDAIGTLRKSLTSPGLREAEFAITHASREGSDAQGFVGYPRRPYGRLPTSKKLR